MPTPIVAAIVEALISDPFLPAAVIARLGRAAVNEASGPPRSGGRLGSWQPRPRCSLSPVRWASPMS